MRPGKTTFASTSVLIADDDGAFRRVMRRRLLEHGYDVIEASDGERALDLLSNGVGPAPDVVVLDVLMPRCSGLGVVEIMRSMGRTTPTLLVTGFGDRSIDLVAGRLGVFRVFHKPFALDELLTGVLEAAKLRRSAGAPRGISREQ